MENKKCSDCGSNEVSIRNEVLELSEPFSKPSIITIKRSCVIAVGLRKRMKAMILLCKKN